MSRLTDRRDDQSITVRACTTPEDVDACLALQKKTWGAEDTDLIPLSGFLIANSTGGQVLGAWKKTAEHNQELVGFTLAYISVTGGEIFLYSHLLAVAASHRNLGIGRRLKLEQRQDAVRRGIERIEWTFDPLEIKNAAFNITGLGAIVRRYKPNYYGDSTSPLQGKLPTDRLLAEWWLNSDRVASALNRLAIAGKADATIQVPAIIGQWKSSDASRSLAADAQKKIREQFQAAFERGLAVVGFVRDREGNGEFQLGYWEEVK